MSDLLRIYAVGDCDEEGYPIPWHIPQTVDVKNQMGSTIASRLVVPAIKDYIRELAGHRCVRCGHPYPPGISKLHPRGEWTPCDEKCQHLGNSRISIDEGRDWVETPLGYPAGGILAMNGPHVRLEAHWRILTVHHLNGHKSDCRWWNLAALCQRCHLTIQGRVVMERAFILEHSEWFKPYAAGWYAAKYLDEDLTREETMERLDELLGLEALV